jgi:hypothetical protein
VGEGVSQYVSIKDDAHDFSVRPKTWTLLRFTVDGKALTTLTPTQDGVALWAWYINVDAKGGAKKLAVRFIRDPKGIADYTGEHGIDLTAHDKDSHLWMFKAKKGQPVGVQVWHDGTAPLVISTREFKLSIS